MYKDLALGWVCSSCGYHTMVKTNLRFHIESKHVESPGFQCSYCPKVLQNRKALLNHVARKHKY